MSKRFIIAGGGTGGHIFPAIAIANALRTENTDCDILFVGAKGKMEMEKVPQAGYKIEGIDIAGFNRSSLIKNIGLPLKLMKSFVQVRRIVNQFKPDAVIGVGGYSSFPVLRLAQATGIPTFLHESNSFAGKSNILLGKKAIRIFVATDGMEKFFPVDKIVVTGNPVRPAIEHVASISQVAAVKFFGLEPDKKTLLVIGGSLGARSINEAIDAGLDRLIESGMQLIWQTGKQYITKAKERAAKRSAVWVNDFIQQMEQAYAAADMVISRSGAMSTAELCIVQKPVLFVPYPFAAEDHQTENARKLVEKNAAMMIKDNEAKEKLVPVVIDLMNNEQLKSQFRSNIGKYAWLNADRVIAGEIYKNIG